MIKHKLLCTSGIFTAMIIAIIVSLVMPLTVIQAGLVRGENAGRAISPSGQVRYAGPFHNVSVDMGGSVIIDINIGSSTVSGSINFTNDPDVGVLCGAGSFSGTRNGDQIQFSFTSSDSDYECTMDDGWVFDVSATISGDELTNGSYSVSNGQNGTFSAKRTQPYSGRFTNTSNGLQGDVEIDLAIWSSSVAGYIDFTNDPGGAALCGAGSFAGTKDGNTIDFSFLSNDFDSGCTFDDGWTFDVSGTLSGNSIINGYYAHDHGQSGTFYADGPGDITPDLKINSGLELAPSAQSVGEDVAASFNVHNYGDGGADLDLRVTTSHGNFSVHNCGTVLSGENCSYNESRSFDSTFTDSNTCAQMRIDGGSWQDIPATGSGVTCRTLKIGTPVSSVSIEGPGDGYVDVLYSFTASVAPSDATEPVTYNWSPEPESGQGAAQAFYKWSTPGEHAVTVTAENCCGSDSDTHSITLSAYPSSSLVSLNKNAAPIVVKPGQRITYTLTYSNVGSYLITGVTITDMIPITLTNVGYINSGAQITPMDNVTAAWQVEDLEAGQGGVITVSGVINPDLDEDTFIVNQAAVNDGTGRIFETSPVTTTIVIPESKVDWTVIVYLDGDNNLDPDTDSAFNNMEMGACNPNVNVITLWDRNPDTRGDWDPGTKRYRVECDTELTKTAAYTEGVNKWDDGESNLGNIQTLRWFTSWAQVKYPADHYWLSIIDHGGGWSPELPPDIRASGWYSGGTGLSWDETGYDTPDYLSTQELGKVLSNLSDGGDNPLDIIFYDAHLMGMLEAAYEIRSCARYLIASENTAWNTFPYDKYIASITASTQPPELAERIVNNYKLALPSDYALTITAFDLSAIGDIVLAVDNLAQAMMTEQYRDIIREQIGKIYMTTQKLDYDSDGDIEQDREGYVDLYDLADQIEQRVDSAAIQDAARGVMNALDTSGFIHAEEHRSGRWNLDDVHGVSIYMPFGEELYIGGGCDEAVLDLCEVNDDTDCIKLRDYYTTTVPPQTQQLAFAQDTDWDEFVNSFIDLYYCNTSRSASSVRLDREETRGLPSIRPISILSEPRAPNFDPDDWPPLPPIGGVSIFLNPRRGVYLPTLLRDP